MSLIFFRVGTLRKYANMLFKLENNSETATHWLNTKIINQQNMINILFETLQETRLDNTMHNVSIGNLQKKIDSLNNTISEHKKEIKWLNDTVEIHTKIAKLFSSAFKKERLRNISIEKRLKVVEKKCRKKKPKTCIKKTQ